MHSRNWLTIDQRQALSAIAATPRPDPDVPQRPGLLLYIGTRRTSTWPAWVKGLLTGAALAGTLVSASYQHERTVAQQRCVELRQQRDAARQELADVRAAFGLPQDEQRAVAKEGNAR